MKRPVIQIVEPLSLQNFRNILKEDVLEWGFIYFNNGWVKPEKELLTGLFTTLVDEPNPQEVSYRKTDEGLSDLFCTCDEKDSKFCRHIAAVLFKEEQVNLSNQ